MIPRMPTLGSRLRTARKRAGLSLEAVGRHLGITAQAVQQWEKDRTEPSTDRLRAVAQLINANLHWLITGLSVSGVTDQELNGFGTVARGGRVVPMLSIVNAITEPIDRSSKDTVHTHFPCSSRAFAIPIFDRSNTPAYEIGDNVVIDPDVLPVPGDMVLAVAGGQPVFGKFVVRAPRIAELQPTNPDWPTISLDSETRIVGVMTEHARARRM